MSKLSSIRPSGTRKYPEEENNIRLIGNKCRLGVSAALQTRQKALASCPRSHFGHFNED